MWKRPLPYVRPTVYEADCDRFQYKLPLEETIEPSLYAYIVTALPLDAPATTIVT